MLFFFGIIALAIITVAIPLLVSFAKKLFPSITLHRASSWLPIVAGVLLVVSTQLPVIHISNGTTTFQQHFVGGGIYSSCLYLYTKQLFGWRFHWALDWLSLYAWVSALGVANKLSEFALLELHLAHIDTSDAYWDLLANTLGGLIGYSLIRLAIRIFAS